MGKGLGECREWGQEVRLGLASCEEAAFEHECKRTRACLAARPSLRCPTTATLLACFRVASDLRIMTSPVRGMLPCGEGGEGGGAG